MGDGVPPDWGGTEVVVNGTNELSESPIEPRQPFTTRNGVSFATRRDRPAPSHTRTTCAASL